MFVLILQLMLLSSTAASLPQLPALRDPPQSRSMMDDVLELLNGDEFKEQHITLVKMGEKAFTAYEAILKDPRSDSLHVMRILGVLRAVKVDRARFVEPAVSKLGDLDKSVRLSALQLLGEIGTSKEGTPIAVLLSNENREVVRAAATSLAMIGNQRALTAIEIWLRVGNHRDDGDLLRHVKQQRDALQKRLDAEAKKLRDGG